ncbi:PREDICTED: cell division cycle and apoptosis regulator protein 1-like, partial [Priapulus caudatus]|uniref:Cell division cycle and apoptosis regulator protein 1-like n=1 Tax=Priapulus caudatus TaxID=37621 RepID=A0ABM1E9K3_PRICU
MSQFSGARKNPPWATSNAVLGVGPPAPGPQLSNHLLQAGLGVVPASSALGNSTSVTMAAAAGLAQAGGYSTQQLVGLQGLSQVQTNVLQQPGVAIPTTLATSQVPTLTVSYPTPRAMQQQQAQQGAQLPPAQQQQQQPKQRVFTGNVTKIHDDFGFVDGDVFFQMSCVKGPPPKVGDRVLVEARFNANMPFKWNAMRIQVLPPSAQVAATDTDYMNEWEARQMSLGKFLAQQQLSNQAISVPGMPTIPPPVMSGPPPLMGQTVGAPYGPPPAGRFSNVESNFPPAKRREPPVREMREERGRDRERERRRERDERAPPPHKRSI